MPMECKPADQSEVAEDKSAENVPLTWCFASPFFAREFVSGWKITSVQGLWIRLGYAWKQKAIINHTQRYQVKIDLLIFFGGGGSWLPSKESKSFTWLPWKENANNIIVLYKHIKWKGESPSSINQSNEAQQIASTTVLLTQSK